MVVPPQVLATWRRAANAGDSVLHPGTRMVVAGARGLCPPGWTGILRLADAVVIERGDAGDDVIDALLGLDDPTDRDAVLALVEAEMTLGPGVLHHCPPREALGDACAGGPTALPVANPETLRPWLAGLPPEDVSESSADDLDRAFVIRVDDEPAALAGWQLWPDDVAHLGVLVAPTHRGRGLGVAVGAVATLAALEEGLAPQWRAAEDNTASIRAALRLGYVETGRQLSLRRPCVRVEHPDAVGVPAPGLAEVARTWWDVDVVPVVTWRDGGATYVLTDPGSGDHELLLARFDGPVDDPAGLARVLAEHLAACDFPPTGDRASPSRVAATLAAARRSERPVAGR